MKDVREFEIDEETKNYTIMDNRRYLDSSISNAALGLLDRITSLPDNWDYSFNGLVAICKDGKSAIRSQINELKEHGYIEIDKLRTEKGTFKYHYRVHNNPQTLINKRIEPAPDFPTLDKPTMDNPTSVNQPQYSTKKYHPEYFGRILQIHPKMRRQLLRVFPELFHQSLHRYLHHPKYNRRNHKSFP